MPQTISPTRVLCVEPDATTLLLLAYCLREDGYDVERARDMRTALEYSQSHSYDLLITDLVLPDGSGWDLMDRLTADSHSDMRTIALHRGGLRGGLTIDTAYGPVEPIAFDAYIEKPFTLATLKSALVSTLGVRARASQELVE